MSWEPLCEPNFLCFSVLRATSGPRVKLAGRKSALNPPVVYSIDRSKAVVPVLVLLCCFVVYSTRRFVLCLALCYFVLMFISPISIAITSLGEERASLGAFVRLFDLRLFAFVCFLFLLVSGWGCGL